MKDAATQTEQSFIREIRYFVNEDKMNLSC